MEWYVTQSETTFAALVLGSLLTWLSSRSSTTTQARLAQDQRLWEKRGDVYQRLTEGVFSYGNALGANPSQWTADRRKTLRLLEEDLHTHAPAMLTYANSHPLKAYRDYDDAVLHLRRIVDAAEDPDLSSELNAAMANLQDTGLQLMAELRLDIHSPPQRMSLWQRVHLHKARGAFRAGRSSQSPDDP